ncbi:hypothetical protein B0H13DRAFT_2462800 [Mycena leptocephala]|nr:hypothetical protein B0H13DRAFT_2462800 [Mycena leptocephala]
MNLRPRFQTVKQNKKDCADLMEKTHDLLNAIIVVYIKSDTGADLPPIVLKHIGEFIETLHKIHTFVEAQQKGSKFNKFLRQGEARTLLTDCNVGLQNAIDFFQVHTLNIITDIAEMQENARKRHQEVLDILLDSTSSDRASSISRVYSGSYNSSNSISMLPSEPKIFHGRESEISEILSVFSQAPRIAILGAGGMGKSSLAKAVIHHEDISTKYKEHRFFVACDSVATKVDLAALIGAHLGLKPGKDLTQPVVQYFSRSSPSLLILDNLETLWEPAETRHDIEEFLSLLTDVDHLALMITMRGAERPAKVAWTRPFLPPLQPLEQEAARDTFIDIADNRHNLEEVDKVLSLTDNMPLVISLLAHLVDTEGCTPVLLRWEEEKTSMLSEGFDKRSNLDLSISLSLSSPRFNSVPHSQELLSLLSILPDGVSDAELVQSKLPIDNIFGCKVALIRTSLAYTDEHKRMKVLAPIREYMQKSQPPGDHLLKPLLKHFQELLELYVENHGTCSGSTMVVRISSNFANIQNVLQNGLQLDHPYLKDSIYCICHLNFFSWYVGRSGTTALIGQLHDHHLEAFVIAEVFTAQKHHLISDPETLISQYLKRIEQVNDTNLKCRFYLSIVKYYEAFKQDLFTAIKFCQTAISLAMSTGNTKQHAHGLLTLARLNGLLGNNSAALQYTCEAQRVASISANLYEEAMALALRAISLYMFGDYKKSMSSNNRARHLLDLCGLSGGGLDCVLMNNQAEVHRLKSEYLEARDIHSRLLHEAPKDQDPYHHALGLLNIAEIDVSIGASEYNVEGNIKAARKHFSIMGHVNRVMTCETILADLYLREGNVLAAESLLKKCLKSSLNVDAHITSYCLEWLGDVNRWNTSRHAFSWTTVYFVHSLKSKEKLGIHRALQFLGDIFLASDDEDTAISLYTVALEGFTQMDVHRSRAECMLHLGDISKGHGDLLNALELWETARPLFERSSQAKQVDKIDRRLASVGDDVLKQQRQNLASLAEPNAPSGAVEDPEDEVSDIEDLEVDLNKAKSIQLVVV